MNLTFHKNTTWFKAVLYIAAVYHILWGISVIFFPCFWFDLGSLKHPNYMQLWQVIGLYEMAFGIGFLLVANNPLRHWRVILMSFLTKSCVIAGFVFFYIKGQEPRIVFNMVLSNHIIWVIPFFIILYNAYRHQYLLDNEMIYLNSLELDELLDFYTTNRNESLKELSYKQPILLIFLRHFGCAFCKETLWLLQKLRVDIENKGTLITLVHLHTEAEAQTEFLKYNLADLDRIADPESMLYKGFNLKRATLSQLLGIKVWIRGMYLWLTKGTFINTPDGVNAFQMPGVFLIHKGEIIKKYIHPTAADIPPYLELASLNS